MIWRPGTLTPHRIRAWEKFFHRFFNVPNSTSASRGPVAYLWDDIPGIKAYSLTSRRKTSAAQRLLFRMVALRPARNLLRVQEEYMAPLTSSDFSLVVPISKQDILTGIPRCSRSECQTSLPSISGNMGYLLHILESLSNMDCESATKSRANLAIGPNVCLEICATRSTSKTTYKSSLP